MTPTVEEIIARANSGAPFPSRRSLEKAAEAIAALDAAGFVIVPRDEAVAEFEITQNGEFIAETAGPRASALAEAHHYRAMYAKDGPIEIVEILRLPVLESRPQSPSGGER
jgi:hypothetical protein